MNSTTLTTEQKAAAFDWLCSKTMVSIRKYGSPDMHFEYFIGVVAKEKSNEPIAQALYNAYMKDDNKYQDDTSEQLGPWS